jgi:stage III sporulation protein SpoIIIAA
MNHAAASHCRVGDLQPMQREITDDLHLLLRALPARISEPLQNESQPGHLLEVVMDLGRLPTARYPGLEVVLSSVEVTESDIDFVVSRIGAFGADNRAGIERTLHRISAIRNRAGAIIGLTCRIGRAVYGTISVVQDLVESGLSILLLGRPGVGKTTLLREIARVIADDLHKRVIVVDTSNEIAGDGDIPHPAIGSARRMQVPTPNAQHAIMIEAVENHMPEVIVIDEIGTELEAAAARTIAERGVQLVGTAHGNTLDNLMMNPTLSDLIGGIQSVTLGDEEARRRGTQKSILERKAPPTFDVLVEIQSWDRVAIHENVAETVDALLRGYEARPEIREMGDDGAVNVRSEADLQLVSPAQVERRTQLPEQPTPLAPVLRLYPFGVSRNRLEQAIRETGSAARIVDQLDEGDAVLTLRPYYRRKPQAVRDAEARNLPIYVLKSNTVAQMEQCLAGIRENNGHQTDPVSTAIRETEDAITEVMSRDQSIELTPQNSYIRRLQHQMAQRYNLASRSRGREPYRRVQIFRDSPFPFAE